MASTYTTFLTYPLEIVGITSEYNTRITAIENFVISDMALTGVAEGVIASVAAILPYFVFWYFCQNEATIITAKTGENAQIQKTSIPALNKQIQNWDIGVDKMRTALGITIDVLESYHGLTLAERIHSFLESEGITINEKYLSKISWL
jgi:hypothetical protein